MAGGRYYDYDTDSYITIPKEFLEEDTGGDGYRAPTQTQIAQFEAAKGSGDYIEDAQADGGGVFVERSKSLPELIYNSAPNGVNAFLANLLGVPEFQLYGAGTRPVVAGRVAGYDGEPMTGGTMPLFFERVGDARPVELTAEETARRNALLQKYPGYSQINPNVFRDVGGGKFNIAQPGADAGFYLQANAFDNAQYDPEFGLLVPDTSFGFAGKKGGIFNEGFGQGLLMVLSAAAPFIAAELGGVALDKINTASVLKGAGIGAGIGGATGGAEGAIKGAIGGATAPVAGAAATNIVQDIGLEPGLLSEIAEGSIKGSIKGVGGGLPGIVTGALGGGLASGAEYAAENAGDFLTETFGGGDEALPELPGGNIQTSTQNPNFAPGSNEDIIFGQQPAPNAFQVTPNPGTIVPNAPSFDDIIGAAPVDLPTSPINAGNATIATPEMISGLAENLSTDIPVDPTADDPAGLEHDDSISIGDVVQGAKTAYGLYDAYKSITGKDLPTVPEYELSEQGEGESDADYQTRVIEETLDYIDVGSLEELGIDTSGLSAEALAEAGLTPGTPEYMYAILTQIDSIIEQIFGFDPSGLFEGETIEDLQGLIRGKTDREMQTLLRALYARGALNKYSGRTTITDPFGGGSYEVPIGPDGQIHPDIAGYQRGIAQFGEDLTGLENASAARSRIDEFLNRDVDVFGMKQAAEERRKRDERLSGLFSALGGNTRRRRGEREELLALLQQMYGRGLFAEV